MQENQFSPLSSQLLFHTLFISLLGPWDSKLFSVSQCFLAASLCKEIYSALASLTLQVMELVKDTGQRLQISVDLNRVPRNLHRPTSTLKEPTFRIRDTDHLVKQYSAGVPFKWIRITTDTHPNPLLHHMQTHGTAKPPWNYIAPQRDQVLCHTTKTFLGKAKGM